MKRFLSLVMAFLCCIACIPSAMAYNAPIQSGTVDMDSMQLNEAIPVYSFETNEYDMYTNLQSLSESTLLASGYSEDEVAAIKNTTIEDLLYQRAQLSSDDLQMMGYSEDEIPVEFTITKGIMKLATLWDTKIMIQQSEMYTTMLM